MCVAFSLQLRLLKHLCIFPVGRDATLHLSGFGQQVCGVDRLGYRRGTPFAEVPLAKFTSHIFRVYNCGLHSRSLNHLTQEQCSRFLLLVGSSCGGRERKACDRVYKVLQFLENGSFQIDINGLRLQVHLPAEKRNHPGLASLMEVNPCEICEAP
jgi:hypothetical protein